MRHDRPAETLQCSRAISSPGRLAEIINVWGADGARFTGVDFYKGDLNKSLFFGKDENIFGRSKVSLVPHDSARPEACERNTRPQNRTVSGYFMEDDDVICISTSNGAWAVLDVLEWGGTGGKSAVMDVTLWPPKGAPTG